MAEEVYRARAELPANGVDVVHFEIERAGQPRLVCRAIGAAAIAGVERDDRPRRGERLKLIEERQAVGNQQQPLARTPVFEVETDAVIRRDVAVGHRATSDAI